MNVVSKRVPLSLRLLLVVALVGLSGGLAAGIGAEEKPIHTEAAPALEAEKSSARVRWVLGSPAGAAAGERLRRLLNGSPGVADAPDEAPAAKAAGSLPDGTTVREAPDSAFAVVRVAVDADGRFVLTCVEGASAVRSAAPAVPPMEGAAAGVDR